MFSLEYARHHVNGVNFMLYKFHILPTAKRYYAGNAEDVARRLAKALHYAQDGVVPKYAKVKGALREVSVRADELHDVAEKCLSVGRDVLRSKLSEVYDIYVESSREKLLKSEELRQGSQNTTTLRTWIN